MSESYIVPVEVRSVTASHTSNLLGALAVALSDRMADAMAADGAITDAAALSALHHILDRPSIDRLRQVLGLTHSGAVRLVDRLGNAGLVIRTIGPDRRTTTVTLTAAGEELAARVTTARAAVLEAALAPLDASDRKALDRTAGTMLVGMMRGPGASRWICRLCDTTACGRYAGDCPIGREAAYRNS